MIESTIANRYARALIKVAADHGKTEEYLNQLKSFAAVCDESSEMLEALSYRWHDFGQRRNALDQILSKLNLDEYVQNFIRLLLKKGRLEIFNIVCEKYEEAAFQTLNRQKLKVVSAVELSDEHYQTLEKHFAQKTGKEIVVQKNINTDVLGGVSVHIGNEVYDYTLKKQLEVLEHKMLSQ
jgi:F-type H+-transporting ATPase subunit delta